MENKIINFITVVILGILIGVLLTNKNPSDLDGSNRLLNEIRLQGQQNQTNLQNLQEVIKQINARLDVIHTTVAKFPAGGDVVKQAPQRPTEDYETRHDIPVAHSKVLGNPDAPVTIVEFVDFQCPFCTRFHPAVEEVVKNNPDKVNYIIKNFPLGFHAQARPAAKAALAAGEQGKYREMAGLLLQNSRNLSEDKFIELAQQLGLDVERFKSDYKNKDAQWEEIIKADMELAQEVGVRGTPTFYINGRKTRARSVEQYEQEIERELKELNK